LINNQNSPETNGETEEIKRCKQLFSEALTSKKFAEIIK